VKSDFISKKAVKAVKPVKYNKKKILKIHKYQIIPYVNKNYKHDNKIESVNETPKDDKITIQEVLAYIALHLIGTFILMAVVEK
jgi:hypothetical protein